eukprot:1017186-Alexandrium_andersonii.AAC.1
MGTQGTNERASKLIFPGHPSAALPDGALFVGGLVPVRLGSDLVLGLVLLSGRLVGVAGTGGRSSARVARGEEKAAASALM